MLNERKKIKIRFYHGDVYEDTEPGQVIDGLTLEGHLESTPTERVQKASRSSRSTNQHCTCVSAFICGHRAATTVGKPKQTDRETARASVGRLTELCVVYTVSI